MPVFQLFLTWTIQTRATVFVSTFGTINDSFCFGLDNPSKDLNFQNLAPHLQNYFALNQYAD